MHHQLQEYEIEVLRRIYLKDIIGKKYRPIELVERIIKWNEISSKFRIRKGFKRVAKRLVGLGYLSNHGKSMSVISITKKGVLLVESLEE